VWSGEWVCVWSGEWVCLWSAEWVCVWSGEWFVCGVVSGLCVDGRGYLVLILLQSVNIAT
jgi:hypothetical protein